MIFAKFDDEHFPIGFWDTDAYAPPGEDEDRNPIIPSDAVEITRQQYVALYDNQGKRKFVDGHVVSYAPPPPEPVVPEVVSSRQFFLQLSLAGLSTQVEGWVSQQEQLVQIAFNKSATFRRDDEMLMLGFDALGFTIDQVDAFFTAAARL